MLKNILYSIWSYSIFFILALILVLILPIIRIFTFLFDKTKKTNVYIIKFFMKLYFIFNIFQKRHFDFQKLKDISKKTPTVFIINHTSIFDLITLYTLPGAVRTIMKGYYLKIPVVGWVSFLSGNIILKKKIEINENVLNQALNLLKSGSPLAIYPEGKRSKTGKVDKFHLSPFKIAKRAKAQIIPVIFDNFHTITPGSFLIKNRNVHVKILKPLKYEDYKNLPIKKLSLRVRRMIISGLLEIRDKRRKTEKNYYGNQKKYIKLDDEMRLEIKN